MGSPPAENVRKGQELQGASALKRPRRTMVERALVDQLAGHKMSPIAGHHNALVEGLANHLGTDGVTGLLNNPLAVLEIGFEVKGLASTAMVRLLCHSLTPIENFQVSKCRAIILDMMVAHGLELPFLKFGI